MKYHERLHLSAKAALEGKPLHPQLPRRVAQLLMFMVDVPYLAIKVRRLAYHPTTARDEVVATYRRRVDEPRFCKKYVMGG